MSRHIVVVDLETTGFDPAIHQAIECSWWDLTTGYRGTFIPRHDVSATLGGADVRALQINRYVDRIATAEQDTSGEGVTLLAKTLHGNTLAGSNPAFDAKFLNAVFDDYADELDVIAEIYDETVREFPCWHHRLWDLAPYAAGVLGLDHLPGLAEVCDLLDIASKPDHSAEADVTATGECFLELFRRAGVPL
jgi:DNA polymerase-3 subunit epsilon